MLLIIAVLTALLHLSTTFLDELSFATAVTILVNALWSRLLSVYWAHGFR